MKKRILFSALLALYVVIGTWKGYVALFDQGAAEPKQIFPCPVAALPESDQQALKNGAWIVTDTKMALSGINKKSLQLAGGEAHCFISDEDIAQAAKEQGTTRASVCVDKAARLGRPLIYAVGNAPTALIRLYELIRQGTFRPELIIGVPVGFVNVVQSKELIMQTDVPYIVAKGRKGGSNVAAAICNALLYQLDGSRK